MMHIISKTKTRVSKKSLAALPCEVAETVRHIQEGHPNIKSFTFLAVTPNYPFSAGEGEEISVICGENAASVEMGSENTVGAAGISYKIGQRYSPPVGSFVLVVSYYGQYWLNIYNVQPEPLA